jgi:hypothetical protein
MNRIVIPPHGGNPGARMSLTALLGKWSSCYPTNVESMLHAVNNCVKIARREGYPEAYLGRCREVRHDRGGRSQGRGITSGGASACGTAARGRLESNVQAPSETLLHRLIRSARLQLFQHRDTDGGYPRYSRWAPEISCRTIRGSRSQSVKQRGSGTICDWPG